MAAKVRGDQAESAFYHMFCPMVKGGAGDWLQANDRLVNPYWGHEMLKCGLQAHRLPVRGSVESLEENALPAEHADDAHSNHGANR